MRKNDELELRSSRSLEGRMSLILLAVRSLKGCVHQVENMHLSGASEQDIMDKAKHLLMQKNIKFKKGFRFDHVWILMKDIPKFTDKCQHRYFRNSYCGKRYSRISNIIVSWIVVIFNQLKQ